MLSSPVFLSSDSLPVTDPGLDFEGRIAESAKSMRMIEHQKEGIDESRYGYEPSLSNNPMSLLANQPASSVLVLTVKNTIDLSKERRGAPHEG